MRRADLQRVGWLAACALAGAIGMGTWTAATSLYADLKFLHAARLFNEQPHAQPAPGQ